MVDTPSMSTVEAGGGLLLVPCDIAVDLAAEFPQLQHLNWSVDSHVQKWDDAERLEALGLSHASAADILAAGYEPDFDELWWEGNLLLNNGINRLMNLLIGTGSIVGYTNAVSRLGVGDGTTAVAATDTDMSAAAGSTHRWFNAIDSTFPSISGQTGTWKATFASADGNFAWNEWGLDGGGAASAVVGVNDATHAALLNRVKPASSMGTKIVGSSWALTVGITIS